MRSSQTVAFRKFGPAGRPAAKAGRQLSPVRLATEGRLKNYWDMYTINDNVCGFVAEALIDAHHIYGERRLLVAIRKLGDFLILAQMPEPQPAWAQQYSYAMHPIWAGGSNRPPSRDPSRNK